MSGATAAGALLGTLVGFSLGLTGGGGAIFAVPLLVHGLALPPRAAVAVSLLTVGCTAAIGCVQRARRGLVEFPTGLMFAAAGMVGAPAGAWLADRLPDVWLLAGFAGLMLVIAARMWLGAGDEPLLRPAPPEPVRGPACRRDREGRLRITSRCALVLGSIGLATGVLAGLFGVGGGFLIVPALVFFSGLDMRRAIGTSLLVIALVSAAGIAGHLAAGRDLPLAAALPFTAGSVAGLFAGAAAAGRIGGPALRRVFAAAIVLVAIYVLLGAWNAARSPSPPAPPVGAESRAREPLRANPCQSGVDPSAGRRRLGGANAP